MAINVTKKFDIDNFRSTSAAKNQYQRQLKRLTDAGKGVDCIEKAVRDALTNLEGDGSKSFVIYGEPQSGKTEMMICLTAKLLDEGRPLIVHLLNDSVDLLGQNLGRFKASGLAPSAQNFSEILDPAISLGNGTHVIFCKKNASDLKKFLDKVGKVKDIVVIDDEADYASPNGNVNKDDKTRINRLISQMISNGGDYIGVTATPARLDLNNTFNNDSALWVNFPAHKHYTGQNVFFPFDEEEARQNEKTFRLTLLSDKGDDPRFIRTALISFMVNVAYLNTYNNQVEANYSMLVHTSGKVVDHKRDWDAIKDTFETLVNNFARGREKIVEEIWHTAHDRYVDADPDQLTQYILENIGRNAVILLNSDSDFRQNGQSATNPSSLFTVVIGGNIVSRGVTFDNLLSMFFTRDVKQKLQQDTYIQRARMFGARGKYLDFFELTIPKTLYDDWHRCFIFHRLSLASITAGKGSPVWLGDRRISAVASASVDKSTVDIKRGEMGFSLFRYTDEIDELTKQTIPAEDKIRLLIPLIGDDGFPEFFRRFMLRFSKNPRLEIVFQKTAGVYPSMSSDEKATIARTRGMMGQSQTSSPTAKHFLKIFTNEEGFGRLYYKYVGSIEFSMNQK